MLPLEFARESSDGRITLVIVDTPNRVQSLWAMLMSRDLRCAKEALAVREGVSISKRGVIGFWTRRSNSGHREVPAIGEWALQRGLDGVVWTALKPGFGGARGKLPTEVEVIEFLRRLNGRERLAAEEYVRKAPTQINTRYRRRIEEELGWRRCD
jgi:hypothetical protein